MREKCLFKVTVSCTVWYRGTKPIQPVYVICDNKKEAAEYVTKHLRNPETKVKSVSVLGVELGLCMYHGKPEDKR
jgi:hypothetical protein